MEDKESTESGSPGGNSESSGGGRAYVGGTYSGNGGGAAGVGGVVPGVINVAVGMNMERTLGMNQNHPAVVPVGGGGADVTGCGDAGTGESISAKKKRGRPRKYDSDGNLSAAYLASPTAMAARAPQQQQPGFTLSTPGSSEFYSSGSKKGGRGRPPNAGNWQVIASLGQLFSTTAGGDFTPHVVTVHTGEDVAGKILTYVQKGIGGVCVLSANGSVSNVTIRSSSGGLMTYEGRFEILTLTGSFTFSDKTRTGGLSVSLASPDGRVIGGGVAGSLTAATPIQIVVGSFMQTRYKTPKRKYNIQPKASPTLPFSPANVTAAVPLSQNNPYPMPTPQFPAPNLAEVDSSLSNKGNPNSASTDSADDWNDSGPSSDQKTYPDINLSIPTGEH